MKKVLVTGAAGFIGSQLVEQLLDEGASVSAMVRYGSQGSLGWLEQLTPAQLAKLQIIRGDIRDPWSVLEASKGMDVIFHLAALISIPYSYHAPDAYIETNIRGTLNVLNAARHHQTARVVVTSTSEVYGTARTAPISEEHPLQGQSPYSATKIGADQLALSFHKSFGLPVTILRPFNCYGPRQSTRAIIPTVITQVLNKSPSIKVGHLTPTRDFTHVRDTARAFIQIAQSEAAIGKVLNAGSGSEISIQDLIAKIQSICGTKLSVEATDEKLRPEASEVYRLIADTTLARKTMAWEPEITLDQGLRQTIEWFSVQKNLAHYRDHRGFV